MFLPYETSISYWFSSSPLFSWEPVVPEAGSEVPTTVALTADPVLPDAIPPNRPDAADPDVDRCASKGTTALPTLRLVFKGLSWTLCSSFTTRESVGWNQAAVLKRETDEDRGDDAVREQQRLAAKAPKPQA